MKIHLEQLGWNEAFQTAFQPFQEQGYEAGRITVEHKHLYRIYTQHGELLADLAGKMRFDAVEQADFPAVGDWVVLKTRPNEGRATIHAILPRKSKFSRKAAGTDVSEQIVAANVDTVFIVMALNQDFNLRRMERYLVVCWESGAAPVVLLTKADLCDDVDGLVSATESASLGASVHVVSALQGEGLDDLSVYIRPGKTVALVGSSGVGKSTLVNALLGKDKQATRSIREGDDKGKHTTTHRELLLLEQGGMLIDTPGMRELQIWEAGDGIGETFDDIETLARQCRFRDCTHRTEVGCAVQSAILEGSLSAERFHSFQKLQRELAFIERKQDKAAQAEQKNRWKQIHKQQRQRPHR